MERPDPALFEFRNSADASGLIGRSAAMVAVRALISRAGPSEAPILLTGATGSGKDVAARAIHTASHRAAGPFVAVNCAAVPRDLLESEFFGHERGAFTGALERRTGMFELAKGGTLFLDEIGDMPLDLQAKLLRALEDALVRRVGGTVPVATDVRIVAATNQDLAELVAERRFRADLYYRLEAIVIALPPLAERREDIADLVRHFADRLDPSRELTFTQAALDVLVAHDWPGNVRQLRNTVLRAAVLHAGERVDGPTALALLGTIAPAPRSTDPAVAPDLRTLLADTEIELIGAALRSSDFVVSEAARALGLSRTTLIERIRKHRIELREEFARFAEDALPLWN